MSEALSLLAAVAEQADTLNHEHGAAGSSLRSKVEQTSAANGVASTYAQEAELASMVCGVVENYVKRTVATVLTPSGQQQGVMVNLELLLQLATLVVGIVRRDAAVAAAVEAASPGQSAASLTSELQLMDVLVKTLNSQDEYPQHSQQPQQSSKQPANPTAFHLLMQHGSSSCLSSDSNLPIMGAEAAAAAGAPTQRGRVDLPTSPKQLSPKQPAATAAANGAAAAFGAAASTSLAATGCNPTAGDVVSVLKQMYLSSDPSAAATAMALAAQLATSSNNTAAATATAPLLRSLPIAQGAAAAAAPLDARAHEALAALAVLQQQQYHAAAADVMQRQNSSSLERLSLDSSSGGGGGAAAAGSSSLLQQAAAAAAAAASAGHATDPSMLMAAVAAAAAGQVDPSVWASALSAAAAAANQPGYATSNPLSLLHPGFACTPPPAAAAAADANHAAVAAVAGASKADKYRERRAARASGASGVKSAGASPTAATATVTAAAAAANQMRRSASYQAALNDLRLAQHAALGQSVGGAAPMVE